MVTRRVSEEFYWFLVYASGCQYTQLQKLICLRVTVAWLQFAEINIR